MLNRRLRPVNCVKRFFEDLTSGVGTYTAVYILHPRIARCEETGELPGPQRCSHAGSCGTTHSLQLLLSGSLRLQPSALPFASSFRGSPVTLGTAEEVSGIASSWICLYCEYPWYPWLYICSDVYYLSSHCNFSSTLACYIVRPVAVPMNVQHPSHLYKHMAIVPQSRFPLLRFQFKAHCYVWVRQRASMRPAVAFVGKSVDWMSFAGDGRLCTSRYFCHKGSARRRWLLSTIERSIDRYALVCCSSLEEVCCGSY